MCEARYCPSSGQTVTEITILRLSMCLSRCHFCKLITNHVGLCRYYTTYYHTVQSWNNLFLFPKGVFKYPALLTLHHIDFFQMSVDLVYLSMWLSLFLCSLSLLQTYSDNYFHELNYQQYWKRWPRLQRTWLTKLVGKGLCILYVSRSSHIHKLSKWTFYLLREKNQI